MALDVVLIRTGNLNHDANSSFVDVHFDSCVLQ